VKNYDVNVIASKLVMPEFGDTLTNFDNIKRNVKIL